MMTDGWQCRLTGWLVVLLLLPVTGWAKDWDCRLAVKSGVAENALTFGQRSDGTAGFDGRYDVPALLRGAVQARFVSGNQGLWRDIKGPGAGEWRLTIEVTDMQQPVILSWQGCPAAEEQELILDGFGRLGPSGSQIIGSGQSHYQLRLTRP